MKHIVKRAGHTEPYDVRKLHVSIYAACLGVGLHQGAAEQVAREVVHEFNEWLSKKHEVTSNDIRRQAAKYLREINPDAGHLYLHHRVIW